MESPDLDTWEAELPPLTVDERLNRLAPLPVPDGLAPEPSTGNTSTGALPGAGELARWQRGWVEASRTTAAIAPNAGAGWARWAYVGLRRAQWLLEGQPLLLPTLDGLQGAHRLLFGACPWSGALRCAHRESARGRSVLADLEALAEFTRTLFKRAGDAWANAEGVAFYHAEFLRVRPFVDGNHLLALLVAGAQMELLFGQPQTSDVDQTAYAEAMQRVTQRVSLRPLTRWFHSLVERRHPVPFAHDSFRHRRGRLR